MPGFNPDNINIHDLIIEDPENKDVVFDLKKDITPEDWEYLKKDLEKLKQGNEHMPLLHRAESLKIVNPNVDVGLDQDDLRKILSALLKDVKRINYGGGQDIHDEIYWPGFTASMAAAKIIDPEMNFDVTEKDWQKMDGWMETFKQKAETGVSNIRYNKYLSMLVGMKIIKPETSTEMSPATWQKITSDFEKLKNVDKSEMDRGHFFSLARSIKILNPAFDLNIGQKDWQYLKNGFETLYTNRESVPVEFLSAITNISILTAEKVEIDENGFRVIPSHKFSETEAPSLPEQRKF